MDLGEGLALGVSALSGIGALYAVFTSKKKVAAEAEKTTIEGATTMVETVLKQLDYFDKELTRLKDEVQASRHDLEAAQAELRSVNEQLINEKVERAKDRRRLTRIENWAKVLFQQVIDLGGTPVPLEKIGEPE